MFGPEGAVVRLRAIVCQIAVDDEVGNVLHQLTTPGQHRPGEQKQQRDGDEATHAPETTRPKVLLQIPP